MNASKVIEWWKGASSDERREFLDGIGEQAFRVNRLTYNVIPGVSEKEIAASRSELVGQSPTGEKGDQRANTSSGGQSGGSSDEGAHRGGGKR